jgi:TDG/mug DNA glycosylase family protein
MPKPKAPFKPTAAQLEGARNKRIHDLIADGLDVLFVGINPGLYSGAVGHHFARPGNRFWPVLERSGFTPRKLSPFEENVLLELGVGITNIAPRTTATAAELTPEELAKGGAQLRAKVRRHRPKTVAVLGVTAYRTAFGVPKAKLGLQSEAFEGARLWILPNPSGLNAHHQLDGLATLFRELKRSL